MSNHLNCVQLASIFTNTTGMSANMLRAEKRDQDLVQARILYTHIARSLDLSESEIAQFLQKDRSTVNFYYNHHELSYAQRAQARVIIRIALEQAAYLRPYRHHNNKLRKSAVV